MHDINCCNADAEVNADARPENPGGGRKPENPGKGKKHGHHKVGVCHFDAETGKYAYKLIPAPAVNGHIGHGDVVAENAGVCDALNAAIVPPEA